MLGLEMRGLRFLLAFDSFKDSLSALQVGEAAKQGIYRVFPNAEVVISPMADGGEGTIEALLQSTDAREVEVLVHDPLMRPVVAKYAVMGDEDNPVVFIESARSSGLPLLPKELRNPMKANTYGLGEQIRDAIERGYRNLVISLGGSATNDGGLGVLQALGWELYDSTGNLVGFDGNPLLKVERIFNEKALPLLKECTITIASDVTNVFYGKTGAAYVFGKQKGASERDIEILDQYLRKLSGLFQGMYGVDIQSIPGAGAAGGLGGAIVSALNGKLTSGVQTVVDLTGLEEKVKWADIVLTGEGSIDQQSIMGKVPSGVGELAKKHEKPVIGIAGRIDEELDEVHQYLDAIFSIQTECRTLEEALVYDIAFKQVRVIVEQVMRLYVRAIN
jgi:glycerate kinase